MRVGFEDDLQLCCAGEEFVVVGGQQRARHILGRARVPVGAQFDQQPVAMHRYGGVGRCVDADQLAAAQFIDLVVEEIDGAAQHRPLETRCAVHRCRDDDIGARGAEHRLGLLKRLPATPSLDQPRIPGLGERTLPEVGAEQHGVLVFPADLRLRLG